MASDAGSGQRSQGPLDRLLRRSRSEDTLKSPCDSIAKELDDLQGDRIPEYDAAIRSCSVTLQQVVEVRHKVHKSHVQEKNSLICYEKLLWQAYQQAQGEIKQYYFSTDQRAAAVLIDPHSHRSMDIDLFYPLDVLSKLTPQIETVLWTCISQFQTIAELDLDLKGQDVVFFELYLIVIYLFVVVESQQPSHRMEGRQSSDAREAQGPLPARESQDAVNVPAPGKPTLPQDGAKAIEDQIDDPINVAIKYANSHLGDLADRISQFAKRDAQVVYVRGMLPGALCVLALVAIYVGCLFGISAGRHWTFETYLSWFLIPIALTCGALGATVSVLLRVANQPLSIDYHAGHRLIRTAGVIRPIVGAVFGLVFYIVVNAGLLQALAAPSDIVSRAHYIAAICFVAGFSERRAQDVIVRALPAGVGAETAADKPLARRPEEDRTS
jgi:hypothetical protein